MLRNVIMYAYNSGSKGGRLLREGLGIRQIRHNNSNFRGGPNWKVINWGSGANHWPAGCQVINQPQAVRVAANKRACFDTLLLLDNAVSIPEFTTTPQIARGWLLRDSVCIRHSLTGKGGDGLKIVSKGDLAAFDAEPVAPLYTKFVAGTEEYRVHVFDDRVIHCQKKLRRRGAEGDRRIRNTANGWVFSSNYQPVQLVKDEAVKAVRALGLDFGAVDMLYKPSEFSIWRAQRTNEKAYVLEINTAPGIEGVSLAAYVEAFKQKLE